MALWRSSIGAGMRSLVAGGALAICLVALPASPASASSGSDPLADIAPSGAFFAECGPAAAVQADPAACDATALQQIDAARAGEGLGPMILPTGFDTMSDAEQIMVVTDLERVARGLAPVVSESPRLDQLAVTGVGANTDPGFPTPFDGDLGGSNWAGGMASPLLADFEWMYDDGPGSDNIDCTSSDTAGCWGHRDNILAAYDGRILMGAAETTAQGPWGASSGFVIVSADTTDAATGPSWASIAATIPTGTAPTPGSPTTPPTADPAPTAPLARTIVTIRSHVVPSGAWTEVPAQVRAPDGLPARGVTVLLERRTHAGGPWAVIRRGRTDASGHARFAIRPPTSASYRVVSLPGAGVAGATSGVVRITVV